MGFQCVATRYYISALRLQVREKITLWCHDKYMRAQDMIFYKDRCYKCCFDAFCMLFASHQWLEEANKVGKKIENCDHQITSDVERFSEVFADPRRDMKGALKG